MKMKFLGLIYLKITWNFQAVNGSGHFPQGGCRPLGHRSTIFSKKSEVQEGKMSQKTVNYNSPAK